jgi:hypothetical protein
MAKNRKSQSAGLRFGPAVKAFLLCALFCGSGVGYVWQKDQIARLAKQIKSRELRLGALEDENEKQRKQLAKLRSPQALELKIKELNLGLAAPQPGQVRSLPEPPAEGTKPEHQGEYAVKDK